MGCPRWPRAEWRFGSRLSTGLWLLGVCALSTLCRGVLPAAADPGLGRPGYSLTKVSAAVSASGIAQLAFRPGDTAHLYAARTSGVVTRYDYDAVTGHLANALDVAAAPGYAIHGLGFHGGDLYVSLNDPPAGARLARFSAPDATGLYRTRHDFVHSIPTGTHGINQIRIVGSTLYVGIGAASRTGNPAVENVYTMTLARIVDLGQVDFPTALTSGSHEVSIWSADRTVAIHWTGAADAGSGVSGYSVRWDNKPSTVPDALADTTAQTATSPSLSNGANHYVHLRTVDKAGNWSATAVHRGPFLIDGTPPTNGILTAAAGTAKISLAWNRFADATSGLSTASPYRLVFGTAAFPVAGCANGTSIFVGAAAQFQHQGLVPGTRYFYRLCASDKAGNVSTGATASAVAK